MERVNGIQSETVRKYIRIVRGMTQFMTKESSFFFIDPKDRVAKKLSQEIVSMIDEAIEKAKD